MKKIAIIGIRLRFSRIAIWVLLAFVTLSIFGCLPITKATIQIGTDYGLSDMERAEVTVEKIGFSRIMFEPKDEQPLPRAEYTDRWVSGFELNKAFGVSVSLNKKNGSLMVGFAERNTRFSAQGTELLGNLLNELRSVFGEKVSVSGQELGAKE